MPFHQLPPAQQREYIVKVQSELKEGIRAGCLVHQTGARTLPGNQEWSDKLKTAILINTPRLDLRPVRPNPNAARDMARFKHHLGNTITKAEAKRLFWNTPRGLRRRVSTHASQPACA